MKAHPDSSPCPMCDAPLEAGACPRCLMRAALQPTGNVESPPPPSLKRVGAAFPHLEILELIGQGGMGHVYKVRQPKLDRLAALKLLPASLAERDAAFARRFEREGQLLARLHHPNIVTVHDSGVADGFFYLLMEYVDGVNLRQALRAGRFSPAQALAIVPKVCDALQFAHEEGVLHRDIKPENILLDAKGRVKLADFGIAKLLAEGEPVKADSTRDDPAGSAEPGHPLTQLGAALGTPSYMAPEQRQTPAEVDHRADIYSLGVVLYELLTGELPRGAYALPSAKADTDPRLDAIVAQALEKDRERRQKSAGEVKSQGESVTGSADSLLGGNAKTSPSIEAPQPTRLRRLAIVGPSASAALLLAAALVLVWMPNRWSRKQEEFTPPVLASVNTVSATFDSVTREAQALFAMIVPNAEDIGVRSEDEFSAQFATQEFEIHTQFKTGEVARNARKQTGPSSRGFILTVQRLKEPLVSAAADLPQSFDEPYWKRYVNRSFDPKTGQGVAVYFDYGAQLDPDFKRAMLELLQLRDGAAQEKTEVRHPPQHAATSDDPSSPAHFPLDMAQELKTKRNEQLAAADAAFREGITRLAEKIPALQCTDKGTLSRSLEGKSESGTLRIDFRFPPLTTEGPPIDAPTEATHRVTAVLRPLTPGQAGPHGLTRYGRLGLFGDVIVSAGNPALHAALTQLARETLAPLAELDGTAMPREMGEDYANFATLDDAAKEKIVWNVSEAGSLFRPEHKGICRDLLASQGRYAHANGAAFTSVAIAVAMQQDWREMRELVARIYHRPTSSELYASAFTCLRKWDRIPIPAEILAATVTLHEAGGYGTTVEDADLADATTRLIEARDREAVLVQAIAQALRNPGKGGTRRGWDALVRVLTHLDAVTVRAALKALREESAMEAETVKGLEADHLAALAVGPWGNPVDGVQASLLPEREVLGKSEVPAFKLKLRNQGKHGPFVARQQEVAEVELDGQWYLNSGPVDVLSGPIQPGEYFDNIAIVLDPKEWNSKETREPLPLKAGEHTVRVSMGLEVTPSVRVISNPVKILLRDTHAPPPPLPPIPPAALEQAKAAQVDVSFHDTAANGTYRRLTLHVGTHSLPGSEPWDRVAVSPEQMARVLDHLAWTRFFLTAKGYDSLEIAERQPCYVLQVHQHGHAFYENLGWGRQTGERLEKLRGVLEGDANAAMSKLLAALQPKLRDWEDSSWSAIQNGIQLRVEAERSIFNVGDNVLVRFTFRNTTDRPITVLDAQDQLRGTFHQFTFTDAKGGEIAQESTPDPAWENKGIGEIQVRQEIPAHDLISRTVSLSGWNLAGLGHPYTGIGKEARTFNVTGSYFTRDGLDLKDPKVWLGEIVAKPMRIEIVAIHPPISKASQSADSSPSDLTTASARGKAAANADIQAGVLRILYSGPPWSQGKPLFDDATGYRVEPLGGCAETAQFRAECDAYNQTMEAWAKASRKDQPKGDAR